MTDTEVINSIDNAWRALTRQYAKCPNEGIRCGMNMLARIINKVKSEVEKGHMGKQITIDEWIAMLQKEA